MSVVFNSSPILLALCLIAAAGFTYWTYRRTTPALQTGPKLLLGGLRFVALSIVLILLFDPLIRRSSDRERVPVLALLVDNSASLAVTSGADSAAVRRALVQAGIEELPGRIDIYGFDSRARSFGTGADALDSLSLSGTRTNVSGALDVVQRELRDENLRGVVLVSDGLYNTGRNPVYSAEESVVPVHTVVAGDTSRALDIRIQEVLTNEVAYAGAELPVRVRILSEGFGGERVAVSLAEGGQVLDEAPIELSGDGTEQTADLSIVPDEPGLRQYTVAVSRLEGEVTHRNNARTISVRVVDSRRRVLLIAGAPDPDVGALRQAMGDDPSLEIETRMQRSPEAFYEGDLPTDAADFDLVVLAGFPHPATSPALVRSVAEALSRATVPTIYFSGRRVDPELTRLLGDAVLPVLPSRSPRTSLEAQPALSSAGRSHPVMSGGDAGLDAWSQLPPLVYPDAGWQPSADASVLAGVRARGTDLDDPLIVVRTRVGRRSAAVLGGDIWRWRTLPPSLDAAEGLFDYFVDALVQWLTTPADDRLVRVRVQGEQIEGGTPVRFTGEVYDESLSPLSDAEVSIEVESEAGDAYTFTMDREGAGRYRLDAGTLPEGAYRFVARASRNGDDIGEDRGAFTVGALDLEYQETRADAALMRQIASRSGGRTAYLSEVDELLREVTTSPQFSATSERVVQESSLRNVYLLLILALLLLTAEWILRKRSGMV